MIEDREDPGANPNQPTEEEIIRTYETVYLFSFLVPKRSLLPQEDKRPEVKYPKFSELLKK